MKHVYFAQCDFGGPIKIGCSYAVPARIQAQSLVLPFNLVTIGAIRGSHFIERFLHAWFRQHQIRGEWFEPAPEVWRSALEARTTGQLHFVPSDVPHINFVTVPRECARRSVGIEDAELARLMGTSVLNVQNIHRQRITRNYNYQAALAVILVRSGHDYLLDVWLRPTSEGEERLETSHRVPQTEGAAA